MKKQTIAILALCVIVGGIFGGSVYAQTPTPTVGRNMFTELVDFISQRLGLNKQQVQSAVQEFHTQRQQQRQQSAVEREQNRLNGLVQSGKITEAQKSAILTKLSELRNKYNFEAMKEKSPEERKKQMLQMKDEFKAWVQSQGIDPTIMPLGLPGTGGYKRGWNK